MNRLLVGTIVWAIIATAGVPAVADDDLRTEIESLKQGQLEIRAELAEIKRLLQARSAPQAPPSRDVSGIVFQLGDSPVRGQSDAPLTLIEFTDYQCPYCSRHFTATYPQIVSAYVETGKLRYASLNMPLESIHPLAFAAAEAALCANEQGRFWQMHDRLFRNQRALEPFNAHAAALGLDTQAFDACLASGRNAETVRKNMAEAAKAGVSGTPSFVLAVSDSDNPATVRGLRFIRGAQPYTAFQTLIDAELARNAAAE